MVVTETTRGLQSQKYFLSGPLQKVCQSLDGVALESPRSFHILDRLWH